MGAQHEPGDREPKLLLSYKSGSGKCEGGWPLGSCNVPFLHLNAAYTSVFAL